MRPMPNKLDPDEIAETEIKPKRPVRHKKQKVPEHLKGTRMAKDIRKNGKQVPARPKNKSLGEIVEMDPDDPEFKMNPRKRTTGKIKPQQVKKGQVSLQDAVRADKQRRANARRAAARKGEAVVVSAVEVLHNNGNGTSASKRSEGIYDEDVVVAEGLVSLDDWDNEELVRGYRRARNGKFGPPPKFIPKEIQQELFRRIVARGDKTMRAAYIESIEALVDLAQSATSEKVQLEAIREIMNRLVGKVPDRVHVAQEQPWEQFLADSIQPIGDEWEPAPPVEGEIDYDHDNDGKPGSAIMGADYGGEIGDPAD